MMTLMRDGGVPMWFILAFGLVALVSAIGYAMRAGSTLRNLMKGMGLATLFATLAALAADVGATCNALAGHRGPEISLEQPHGALILLTGLAESMSPLIMGFALLALTSMFGAVGAFREAAAEKSA
jgi:hypothetical protein